MDVIYRIYSHARTQRHINVSLIKDLVNYIILNYFIGDKVRYIYRESKDEML